VTPVYGVSTKSSKKQKIGEIRVIYVPKIMFHIYRSTFPEKNIRHRSPVLSIQPFNFTTFQQKFSDSTIWRLHDLTTIIGLTIQRLHDLTNLFNFSTLQQKKSHFPFPVPRFPNLHPSPVTRHQSFDLTI